MHLFNSSKLLDYFCRLLFYIDVLSPARNRFENSPIKTLIKYFNLQFNLNVYIK